jgi:hypothetical protein
LKDEYPLNDTVEFKFKDIDMGDMHKGKFDLNFKVWSDSDLAGITVNANQDGNWKSKNPYYFYLTDSEESNGDTLYAQVGDALYVEYVDTTLPRVGPNGELNSKSDTLTIIGTTSVIPGYSYVTLR